MIKNKLKNSKGHTNWCPASQEQCKREDCAWFHQQFEKCNLEIGAYNLFKVSKSIDDLLVELKKQ